MDEPWEMYRLEDMVEFTPNGHSKTAIAQGFFHVWAKSRRAAHVTARLHLCTMVMQSGLGTLGRGEDHPGLA